MFARPTAGRPCIGASAPHCGTQVFSEAEERPTLTFVRAGTLDDPNLAAPAGDHLDQFGARLGVLRPHTAKG